MSGRFAIKPTLTRIWHAPDHIRLMDPLPGFHRRGIIVAALVIVICFLWPSSQPDQEPLRRDAQLDIQSSSQPPMQAELTTPPPQTQATRTPQPEPAQTTPQPVQNNDIDQQWRSYRVESGKTMAQLFRDHNLPPADVYAMAQVEGEGRPLSTLQTGQMVQIRQNASGVVTGLTIDLGNDKQVLFTRQPDGSFVRAR
ncbi:OapA family protein [Atlantibacter sp.]|uniref:OapA family protein n=1 Tax=Atlantibacter sp. TaxID=1903473 RepID=UPI0013EF8BCD|nr:LysM-like peptidoglycan-binding domain-containing protein [Atlantibacter sp.]